MACHVKEVRIAQKIVGNSRPTFVVAEAGLNHNGSVEVGKELIRRAADVGADAVKFQSYHTDDFVSRKSEYHQLFKSLELSETDFAQLKNFADDCHIIFLSTPLDLRYVEILEKIGIPAFKIASGDLTFTPLLKAVATTGRPVILSTGASTIGEIYEAVSVLRENGCRDLVLLHCLSSYPAPLEEINLRAISTLRDIFDVPTGYSDHSSGIVVPVAAVALGASLIEKHFTLDKTMSGPDHALSAEPEEFKRMVEAVRAIEKALGDGCKKAMRSEQETRLEGRRSIVSKSLMKRGDQLDASKMSYKRPASGLQPSYAALIAGKRVKTNKNEDDAIVWSDLLEE
jgi:sialic acid synthase SpsE